MAVLRVRAHGLGARLEHASSCTGEIRSCKDLPDSPPMEPVVYFPEIICFVRSWPTRAGTVRRRTTAVHLSTSLKLVAEASETAERRSRKLSLNQSTRARGGAFGPGSPVAMATRATRAGGFPKPDDTRNFIRWRRVRLTHARPHAVACSSWRGARCLRPVLARPLFTQAWGLAHAKGGRDRRHYQGSHDLDDPAAGNRRDGSRDGHEHRLVAGDAPPPTNLNYRPPRSHPARLTGRAAS